jgi:hypothetical protein
MENLALLATLNSEIEAEIIRQKLAEAGIESMIKTADAHNVLPAFEFTEGVGVYVETEDLSVAQGLIGSGSDDLDDDMEVGVSG